MATTSKLTLLSSVILNHIMLLLGPLALHPHRAIIIIPNNCAARGRFSLRSRLAFALLPRRTINRRLDILIILKESADRHFGSITLLASSAARRFLRCVGSAVAVGRSSSTARNTGVELAPDGAHGVARGAGVRHASEARHDAVVDLRRSEFI